jgi:hypothetical protein
MKSSQERRLIMPVVTYEGVVENGQVHLPSEVVLPERATVYVVVPEAISESEIPVIDLPNPWLPGKPPPRVRSPRLANPSQADRFKLEVSEETNNG